MPDPMRSFPAISVRLLAGVALAGILGTVLSGCKTFGPETTGSIGGSPPPGAFASAPPSADASRRDIDALGERYRANPRDAEAGMRYAQALRGNGQHAQAVAVLEQASLVNPTNMALLGAYGRALADNGDYNQATEVLNRAHTPDQPDWRILSAQGAVQDQMGHHGEAQRYYASALKIVPDDPSVLSNLGLSYALSHDLPRAEQTLRRAVAQPAADRRVRQNLALVVGLQGRFAEAETLAKDDLPPEDAAANVAYLRQMLSQQNDWKKLGKPQGQS
jgi:Flp pilus assembly protein TadD